jgi:hydroxypyruvate isomerase
MPDFSANLSMLFTERPFLDRFAAAARAGFAAVEFMFPYDHAKERIADELRRHGLKLVLFNLPAGDWERGERGIACHPDRTDEFRAGVDRAIEYAAALGCRYLNCLAGIAPEGVPGAVLRRTFVDNLRYASARLMEHGMRLLIEPVNTRDVPDFYLHRTAEAVSILDEVGARNLSLQCDVYHMHRMGEPVAETIARYLPRIAHIQIADAPGRHEPGTGEIDFDTLLPFLDRIGHCGWVGCEYKPRGDTDAGLAWVRKLGVEL